jgi:carbon monoxide dehydrogenase subunit G
MPKVSDSVEVAAQPDSIFDFIAEQPARATTFIPGLNRVNNVKPAQAGMGQTWDFEFNWFGLVVSGNSRCTQFEKPRVYQFKTLTGNPSTWTYTIQPASGKTRLTLEVDFEVPQGQLTRFATAGALEQMNRNRAREIVANLKALIEP